MIDGGRCPVRCGMTLGTRLTHGRGMELGVFCLMTRIAGCRRSLEDVVHVARCTGDARVRSGQRERRRRVIDRRRGPACRGMTRLATLAVGPFVRVIGLMAGVARLWRSFEYVVDVARRAGDARMRPGQRERGRRVINGSRSPGCCAVA